MLSPLIVIVFFVLSTISQAQSILTYKKTKSGQTLYKAKDSNTRWMDSFEMCNHLSDDQFKNLSFDDSLRLATDLEVLDNIRMDYLLAELRKDHQFISFENTFGPVELWFYKEDSSGNIDNNLTAGVRSWKYEFHEKKLWIDVRSLEQRIETQKAYVTNLLIFLNQKNALAERSKFLEFSRSTMDSFFFDVVFEADIASSTEKQKIRDEYFNVLDELSEKVTFPNADYRPDAFPKEFLYLAQPYIDKVEELQKALKKANQAYHSFEQEFSLDHLRSLAINVIRGKEKQFYCKHKYKFFLRLISPDTYTRCFKGAVNEICSRRVSEPYIYCHNQSTCEDSAKVSFDREANILKIKRTKYGSIEGSPFSVLLNHPALIAQLPFSQQIFILKALRQSELTFRRDGEVPLISELHAKLEREYELIDRQKADLRLSASEVHAKSRKLLKNICPAEPKIFTLEEMKSWIHRTDISWEDMCSLILADKVEVLRLLDPYRLSVAARFKDPGDRAHWFEYLGEKDSIWRAFDEISAKERELESRVYTEESRLYARNGRQKVMQDVSNTYFDNLRLGHDEGAYPIFFLTMNYPNSYTQLKTEIRNQLALNSEVKIKVASLNAYLNNDVFQLNIKNPTKAELIQLQPHFLKIEMLSKELILELVKVYSTSFSKIEPLHETYRARYSKFATELQVQAEYDLGSDMLAMASVAGRYLMHQNILQIDMKSLLKNGDSRSFLEILLHETFHMFQEIYFSKELYSNASPWMKDMTDLFDISSLKYPRDDLEAHDTHPLEALIVQSQKLWLNAIVKP